MKYIFLVIFVAGMFALTTSTNYACSCIVPDVLQATDKASAVFVGEVIEIAHPRSYDVKAPLAERLYTVKLKVEKAWKGVKSQEITILSDQGSLGCISYKALHKGEKYLIYAETISDDVVRGKSIGVFTTCSRTKLLKEASGDLKELEPTLKPTFGPYRRKFKEGRKVSL
jgi:hypothetical protein